MKSCYIKRLILSNSRGGVLVLVALLMTVLVGVAALAIDIGYISTTKNELQNVADAAALAATGELGRYYIDISTDGTYDSDYGDTIRDVAIEAGLNNMAGGLAITVSQVLIGSWDGDTHTFTNATTYPNAVKVSALRAEGANGPITSFFAGVFEIPSFDVDTDAVAALTGQGILVPGESKLPLGVSEQWFVDSDGDGVKDGCREEIHLSDTGTSCAGWHTYYEDSNTTQLNANLFGTILDYSKPEPDDPDEPESETAEELAARLALELDLDDTVEQWLLDNYRDELDNGNNEGLAWLLLRFNYSSSFLNYINNENKVEPYEAPGAEAGVDSFEFTGGVIGAVFNEDDAMPALFDFFKVRDGDDTKIEDDDGNLILDADGNEQDTWRTSVPVYEDPGDTCTNPNTLTLIVGVADILVKSINPPPDNSVDIEITCSYENVRGSGGTGGVVGTIPNLVE